MPTLFNVPLTPGNPLQIVQIPIGSLPLRVTDQGGQPLLHVRVPNDDALVSVRIFQVPDGDDPESLDDTWFFGTWTSPIREIFHVYVEPPLDGSISTYNRLHERGTWILATRYSIDALVGQGSVIYRCKRHHASGSTTQPGIGASWEDYWIVFALIAQEVFTYMQDVASTVWTVTHNLGGRRNVEVLNSAGITSQATVEHVSANQVTVTFGKPTTGSVIIS